MVSSTPCSGTPSDSRSASAAPRSVAACSGSVSASATPSSCSGHAQRSRLLVARPCSRLSCRNAIASSSPPLDRDGAERRERAGDPVAVAERRELGEPRQVEVRLGAAVVAGAQREVAAVQARHRVAAAVAVRLRALGRFFVDGGGLLLVPGAQCGARPSTTSASAAYVSSSISVQSSSHAAASRMPSGQSACSVARRAAPRSPFARAASREPFPASAASSHARPSVRCPRFSQNVRSAPDRLIASSRRAGPVEKAQRGAQIRQLGLEERQPVRLALAVHFILRPLGELEKVLGVSQLRLACRVQLTEPRAGVLANRLEHGVTAAVVADEIVLDECLQRIEVCAAMATAASRSHPPANVESRSRSRRCSASAPGGRGSIRSSRGASAGVPAARAGRRSEAAGAARVEREKPAPQGKAARAAGGELEREREAVKAARDLRDDVVVPRATRSTTRLLGPLVEERRGVSLRERLQPGRARRRGAGRPGS